MSKDTHIFVLFFSPVTNKRFVLSQYLGGIKKNESGYITKAEATSMSYGVKYTPELNKNTGALVCYITTSSPFVIFIHRQEVFCRGFE